MESSIKKQCFKCGEADLHKADILYGYTICYTCQSKLGLFQDKTIKKYILSFEKAKKKDSNHPSYEEEINNRLVLFEKDYIRKRIKLLHIQDRIQHLK